MSYKTQFATANIPLGNALDQEFRGVLAKVLDQYLGKCVQSRANYDPIKAALDAAVAALGTRPLS